MKRFFSILLILLISFFIVGPVNAETNIETNVIFVGDVPDYIEGDLYLNVINIETNEIYMFYLRDVSNYTAYEYLPNGKYRIVEGGKFNDIENKYQIEYKYFEIQEDNTVVEIKFGESASNANNNSNEVQVAGAKKNKEYKEISENKSWFDYAKWPLVFIVVFLFIFICLKLKKYFKNDF